MNKQMLGLIMGIVLITLASAVSYDLIAGEPYSLTLPEEFDYYSIVGNSSIVDLDITQDGLSITITPNKYSQTDSFEIIFFNQETEIIPVHHYSSSGGGTRTITKEVIKEVPNYIDREVIKEIEVDKEVTGKREMTEKERKFFDWAIIIGYIVLIPLLITVFLQKRKERKSNSLQEEDINERRYKLKWITKKN